MSKYNELWKYIQNDGKQTFKLTFEEIESIIKMPINHAFLRYKAELLAYGYKVEKISMKEKTIIFQKIN